MKLQIGASILVLFGIVACGANHSEMGSEASLQSVSADQIQAFEATLYSFGQSKNCVKCHENSVNPLWMNSNIAVAYNFARPLVDMSHPTASIFATYASNNHCLDPICADPASKAIVQELLTQWASVENSGGNNVAPVTGAGTTLPNPSYVTISMPIPNPLPIVTQTNTPAVIRYDLSQLAPNVPSLNGVILEVSIQSYNSAQTNYKVFNPRLAGNSSVVLISGIHAYVRAASDTGLGVEDINQGLTWSGASVTAAATPLPAPLPTGPMTAVKPLLTTTLGIQAQSTADVLTLGFAVIH